MRDLIEYGALSGDVDLYNVDTGAWTTARLSVARYNLAAASVGNVAVFAGGTIGLWLRDDASQRGLRMFNFDVFVCVLEMCCAVARLVIAPEDVAVFSCTLLQVVCLMLLTCTTTLQGRGPQPSSAWRALVLRQHLSAT